MALVPLVAVAVEPAERNVDAESPAMVFSRVSSLVVLVRAEGARGTSLGSGVIVENGLVVTNHHVVEGARTVTVSLRGKDVTATVLRSVAARDLAVLKVGPTGAARATLRRSSELAVGERVYAIGNPRGYQQTLSEGLVSGLRKEGQAFVVQTSAAISPGSSGGGLFDSRGRLVGITTSSRTDGQSLNFAHPVEWIEELLKGRGDAGVETVAAQFSVSERPDAAWCELSESARWGIFSEGLELLESSPASGEVLLLELNTTQPRMGAEKLVLKDLSRKSQVALFRGGRNEPFVFVSFDEGGLRTTLASIVEERGEPRLITRSGPCRTGTAEELMRTRDAQRPVELAGPEACERDAANCYEVASRFEGGERFLLFKKACALGHKQGCDEAIRLAEQVRDSGSVQQLRRLRESARTFAVGDARPDGGTPAVPESLSSPARRPLRAP